MCKFKTTAWQEENVLMIWMVILLFLVAKLSKHRPLGQFFHRVAMSVYISVPFSSNFFRPLIGPTSTRRRRTKRGKTRNLSKIVLVLLSASVKRFFVSCMRDFYSKTLYVFTVHQTGNLWLCWGAVNKLCQSKKGSRTPLPPLSPNVSICPPPPFSRLDDLCPAPPLLSLSSGSQVLAWNFAQSSVTLHWDKFQYWIVPHFSIL